MTIGRVRNILCTMQPSGWTGSRTAHTFPGAVRSLLLLGLGGPVSSPVFLQSPEHATQRGLSVLHSHARRDDRHRALSLTLPNRTQMPRPVHPSVSGCWNHGPGRRLSASMTGSRMSSETTWMRKLRSDLADGMGTGILCPRQESGPVGLTQTKWSPNSPARFNACPAGEAKSHSFRFQTVGREGPVLAFSTGPRHDRIPSG